MRINLALASMLLFCATADAAKPLKIVGTYTDLRYVEEAGDVVGTEIMIVFGGERGYFAVLECAEGTPSKPVVVAVTVRGAEVEFAPHSDEDSTCPKEKFVGTVTKDGLRGAFKGTSNYPGTLKRGRSYW